MSRILRGFPEQLFGEHLRATASAEIWNCSFIFAFILGSTKLQILLQDWSMQIWEKVSFFHFQFYSEFC